MLDTLMYLLTVLMEHYDYGLQWYISIAEEAISGQFLWAGIFHVLFVWAVFVWWDVFCLLYLKLLSFLECIVGYISGMLGGIYFWNSLWTGNFNVLWCTYYSKLECRRRYCVCLLLKTVFNAQICLQVYIIVRCLFHCFR